MAALCTYTKQQYKTTKKTKIKKVCRADEEKREKLYFNFI